MVAEPKRIRKLEENLVNKIAAGEVNVFNSCEYLLPNPDVCLPPGDTKACQCYQRNDEEQVIGTWVFFKCYFTREDSISQRLFFSCALSHNHNMSWFNSWVAGARVRFLPK